MRNDYTASPGLTVCAPLSDFVHDHNDNNTDDGNGDTEPVKLPEDHVCLYEKLVEYGIAN